MTHARPVKLLLVEDNPADVILFEECLREWSVPAYLHVAHDGVDALACLRGGARPDIIVLDLNMPRMGGIELLSELKREPAFQAIPVIVLTTSGAHDDILKAYGNHANAYVVKPNRVDDFFEVARVMEAFWLRAAKLPSNG